MLLKESENAQLLRSKMLDIVLDTINEQTGGGTKFINRRDANYLPAAMQESNYRKDFTSALSRYVNMGNYKYSLYTDKIYQSIFRENAKEYKQILKLSEKEKFRQIRAVLSGDSCDECCFHGTIYFSVAKFTNSMSLLAKF